MQRYRNLWLSTGCILNRTFLGEVRIKDFLTRHKWRYISFTHTHRSYLASFKAAAPRSLPMKRRAARRARRLWRRQSAEMANGPNGPRSRADKGHSRRLACRRPARERRARVARGGLCVCPPGGCGRCGFRAFSTYSEFCRRLAPVRWGLLFSQLLPLPACRSPAKGHSQTLYQFEPKLPP